MTKFRKIMNVSEVDPESIDKITEMTGIWLVTLLEKIENLFKTIGLINQTGTPKLASRVGCPAIFENLHCKKSVSGKLGELW